MSAPSKILPLRPPVRQEGQPRNAPRTSCRRQYRRCAPLRPTGPTSRGSLPFLSTIAPPFLPFCEQEISWCAYELVRASRRNYRRRWRPSRRPVRPRSTRRAYRRRLRRRSSSSRRARPPRDPQATAPQHRRTQPKREPHARARSPPHVAHVAVAGNLRPESVLRAAHAVYAAVESNRRPLNFIFASRAIVRRRAKREPHENAPGQVVAPVARGGRCRSAGALCRSQVSEGRYSGNGHLDLTIVSPSCFPIRFSPQRSHIIRNVGRCRKVIHQEGDRMWPPKRVCSRN